MDAYRCETTADLEGPVVTKVVGITTNCSTKAPETPDEAPVAPIAAGAGSSLLGLLATGFLLWKRRKQAEGAPQIANRVQGDTQEDDDVFDDTPSEAAPTEIPTESAAPEVDAPQE